MRLFPKNMYSTVGAKLAAGLVTGAVTLCSPLASACGGFFCNITPINQAAEQIIFKQDGDQITTMVRILYQGEATEFGWVLPVPEVPEIALGSDMIFTELENITRPQFVLDVKGESCPPPPNADSNFAFALAGAEVADQDSSKQVTIEKRVEIGPFDAKVISSEDPTALATWLADNNLDLTDRGDELLAPYIQAGMKFLVLHLNNDSDAGDIQPVILKYRGNKPVIPITLTSVAAQPDMGILVWILGQNRAVPENYLHVTPNYTRVNWFQGSTNAYASFQSLITEAMNEAGGQGFATEYAGRFENLTETFTNSTPIKQWLDSLEQLSDKEFAIEFISAPRDQDIRSEFLGSLSLTDSEEVNNNLSAVIDQIDQSTLADARVTIITRVEEKLIAPLDNAIDILDDNQYLTRLYTTLSPEEMTLDPAFVYNPAMEDQPIIRRATAELSCTQEGSEWKLSLGEGTGRDGEFVIDGKGFLPFSAQANTQKASFKIEKTTGFTYPEVQKEENFDLAVAGAYESKEASIKLGQSSGGGSSTPLLLTLLGTLIAIRRKNQ